MKLTDRDRTILRWARSRGVSCEWLGRLWGVSGNTVAGATDAAARERARAACRRYGQARRRGAGIPERHDALNGRDTSHLIITAQSYAGIELTNSPLIVTVDARWLRYLLKWRWELNTNGYAVRGYQRGGRGGPRRCSLMHREIARLEGWPIDADPAEGEEALDVDHVNGDRLDNVVENLRPATHAENCCNRTRKRTGCTSRFKGVCWDKATGNWRAEIRVNGTKKWLGRFDTEAAAAAAYAEASVQLHGAFAAPRVERKDPQ